MKRNGFKIQFIKLRSFPVIKIGAAFAILALFSLVANYFGSGVAAVSTLMATVPFVGIEAPKFNRDGLSGDELALIEKLEKRFKPVMGAEEFNKAVRSAFNDFYDKDGKLNFPVEVLKELLSEGDKGYRSMLKVQGEELAKLKAKLEEKGKDDIMSVRTQVSDWQTRNKEIISRIRNGEKADLPPLEVRAANSPMTPANTISDTISINAGAAIRNGAEVFDVRRIEPTLWDYINKGRTGLETYPWVNKKVPADSGAAAFIGPGVAKPGVSFTFEVEKSNAKKVAVSTKVATELLDDIDGMTSYIQAELTYQLRNKVNSVLMTGVESATSPAGVQTFSLGFTTSGIETVNPNNWDCARAVVAQMRAAFITGPIAVFLNPIDTANMDMSKAISQGTYLGLNARPLPGGAVILEDNNVPVGYLQAIALDCWKNLIYKDFMLKFGWENDDFTKNLVTAIAEMRLHSFHSDNDAAGFVYDDLADIKTQIAAA